MTDLERLTEELAEHADDGTCKGLLAAVRDLLANGQRVEWCEEHEFQIRPGASLCLASPFSTKACRRIVSKLLSVYPKEAENGTH